MKKKNLKRVQRAPELKRGKPVLVQRLVLQTAQRLYNIALDSYCKNEHIRRYEDWVWKTQKRSRRLAWLAVARHVLQN